MPKEVNFCTVTLKLVKVLAIKIRDKDRDLSMTAHAEGIKFCFVIFLLVMV